MKSLLFALAAALLSTDAWAKPKACPPEVKAIMPEAVCDDVAPPAGAPIATATSAPEKREPIAHAPKEIQEFARGLVSAVEKAASEGRQKTPNYVQAIGYNGEAWKKVTDKIDEDDFTQKHVFFYANRGPLTTSEVKAKTIAAALGANSVHDFYTLNLITKVTLTEFSLPGTIYATAVVAAHDGKPESVLKLQMFLKDATDKSPLRLAVPQG
jgi:hypothetical protein